MMENVFNQVLNEINNQNKKWGHVHKDVTGWLLIIESELNESKTAWTKQITGKHSLRNELIQVAASTIQAINRIDYEKRERLIPFTKGKITHNADNLRQSKHIQRG